MFSILFKLFLFGLCMLIFFFFPKCVLCLEILQMNFAIYFSIYNFVSLIYLFFFFCIGRGLEVLLHLKVGFGGKIKFLYCCFFFIFSNASSAVLKLKNSVQIT